jgi:TPR repeat protein
MMQRVLLLLALAGLPKAAVTLAADAESVAVETFARLRARAAGDAVAQFNLGNMYFNGESAAQDLSEALKWYGRAAEQGFEPAEDSLGGIYTTVAECRNVAEGLKWYRLAAGQAFIPAEYHLGQFYENGGAGPENATESAIWYQRAAEHVRAFAQSNPGTISQNGKGVSKDTADGLRLLLTEYAIGSMYAAGSGVPKNSAEAAQWYGRAAEQGLDSAQFQLGEMYAKGEGVAKDSAQAVKWFRMAAEQGNRLWQLKLGNKLFIGEGVPKDSAEAVKWFRMAAFQGNQSAQLMLGTIYETGAGVPKDDVEALAWFNIGAASGGDWVVQHRNDLETQLGHDATLAAQKRSGELFKEIEADRARNNGGAPLPAN